MTKFFGLFENSDSRTRYCLTRPAFFRRSRPAYSPKEIFPSRRSFTCDMSVEPLSDGGEQSLGLLLPDLLLRGESDGLPASLPGVLVHVDAEERANHPKHGAEDVVDVPVDLHPGRTRALSAIRATGDSATAPVYAGKERLSRHFRVSSTK